MKGSTEPPGDTDGAGSEGPAPAEGLADPGVFHRLRILVGTVREVVPFPEARKPAYRLRIDFGGRIGELQSSAQLTRRYTPESLTGTQVLAVANFPPLRIAGFRSECLVLGVVNPEDPGDVVLIRPDEPVPPGWRLG